MSTQTTDRRIGMAPTRTHQGAPQIDFVEAPLGLMGLRSFHLQPLDDLGFLFSMRSVDEEGVRLFVVAPEPYFPEYAPEVTADAVAPLGLGSAPATLLVVVHPGDDEHPPTANLLAPIAINPTTGAALQVVLDSDEWPLRARFSVAS